MKKPETEAEVDAVVMRMAAQEAEEAGKDAMLEVIERHIPPTEENQHNPHLQVGALITASSAVYASMLHVVAHAYEMDPAMGKRQAKLAFGLLQGIISEPLINLGKMADGTYVPGEKED